MNIGYRPSSACATKGCALVVSLLTLGHAHRAHGAEEGPDNKSTENTKKVDATAKAVSTAAPIDLQNGDYVHLRIPTVFIQVDPTTADPAHNAKTVCLPKETKLEFLRPMTRSSDAVNTKETTVLEFRRERRHALSLVSYWPLPKIKQFQEGLNSECGKTDKGLAEPKVDPHLYRIDQGDLPTEYYAHFGVTHGALFVPFKRRPDKSLSGETSLGYFLGYRFDSAFAVTITPIITAGLSLVNVTNDSAITPNSSVQDSGVRAAWTYGFGLILTHLGSFQVGAVYGWDKIGGDAGKAWKYEGKGWYSLAIGYSFAR